MRIIYIHSLDLGKNETSETFVIENAISLAHEGIHVELVINNSSGMSNEEAIKQKFCLDKLPETLNVHTSNVSSRSNFRFYLFAANFVRKFTKPAIIITRSHGTLPYLYLVINRRRHKLIFETHDYYYDLNIRPDIDKKRARKKSRLEQFFFKKLDGLICLNQYQQKLYEQHIDKEKIRVFPTGLKEIKYTTPEKGFDIVYIGSISPRMGINEIIALLPYLDKRIILTIIGGKTTEEISEFKARFPGNKLPENLRITGWINKDALFNKLNITRLGLLPLKDTYFNRYLTVPLKMFDYLAFGLPIVSSNYPTVHEYIENDKSGLLVDWNDTQTVAKRINELITDKGKWQRMSEEVHKVAISRTWSNRAKDQVKYFNSLANA